MGVFPMQCLILSKFFFFAMWNLWGTLPCVGTADVWNNSSSTRVSVQSSDMVRCTLERRCYLGMAGLPWCSALMDGAHLYSVSFGDAFTPPLALCFFSKIPKLDNANSRYRQWRKSAVSLCLCGTLCCQSLCFVNRLSTCPRFISWKHFFVRILAVFEGYSIFVMRNIWLMLKYWETRTSPSLKTLEIWNYGFK